MNKLFGQDLIVLKGMKILLVEDSEDNQQLFSYHFKSWGVQFTIARDGIEALEKMKAADNDFEAVLMDIQMPHLDGYGATEQLRANGCQVPIIALSAYAIVDEKARALAAGFNEYVTKPLNFKALQQVLQKYRLIR